MFDLTISVTKKDKKGRSFNATVLSYVTADGLWDGGRNSDITRPVWMMLGGTESELRPFVANLILGKKAERLGGWNGRVQDRFETLKSVGYNYAWQRTDAGAVVTVWLPDLFRLDPGMVDPKEASFVILPTQEFAVPNPEGAAHILRLGLPRITERQEERNWQTTDDATKYIADIASVFAAYLDRRTRCPLIPDRRFFAQLLVACLNEGLASISRDDSYCSYYNYPWGYNSSFGFCEVTTDRVGLHPGLAFKASHEDLEALLASEVKRYFEVT